VVDLELSDRGGELVTAIYTLIATAKLNSIDPKAWLAEVLRWINDLPVSRLNELPRGAGCADLP
jgi:transposase